jgi:agmatine deiminase
LPQAQAAFAALVREIARDEAVHVLVPDAAEEQRARTALGAQNFVHIPYGDIWLRDIAPIFLKRGIEHASVRFGFNGWGGKYILPHDDQVAQRIQTHVAGLSFACDWIFEGGSVDVDGAGTALTTRQCLLNRNRNPGMDEASVTRGVCGALGLEKLIWLEDGLANDHTDGHIDNIARFVAPGVVAVMRPSGSDDPNRDVYAAIRQALLQARDASGTALEVVEVPSPGRVEVDGAPVPASHLNFYICNAAVIVPIYKTKFDDAALAVIEKLFPDRRTVGVDARALLSGGGAFHCITQQVPR